MGTKRKIPCTSYDNAVTLKAPPGFASQTSFTLKKVADSGEGTKLMDAGSGREFKPDGNKTDLPLNNSDIENLKTSFRHRPWILHEQFDCVSEKRNSELGTNFPVRPHLPKGVIQGCPTCNDCQKVTSSWRPEESRFSELEDAPVFYPTEEEFEDMLKYVSKIRSKAENYGICCIVPPPSWHPTCLLKEYMRWKTPKFKTYIQQIDALQHLYLKIKPCSFHEKMDARSPKILSGELESSAETDEAKCFTVSSDFKLGPELTLESFEKHADEFKRQYFRKVDRVKDPNVSLLAFAKQHQPSVRNIEGEYWRIVENPSEEIEVLCGTTSNDQVLRSGFPVKSSASEMPTYSKYAESDWNLNNIPKLPGSLLSFESCSSSAVLDPQLSMGMCFASHCWRTEEHHLYSICYMHFGSPKVWYSIPGKYCFKFVEVAKKQFPQLCLSDHPELVTQISPSTLMAEGIPVYRCVQKPLEFIVIFPGAYHAEFDCGFNCSESVNFAPFGWLPHGQYIAELYCENYRKTSISHDKLLFRAAKAAAGALWESSFLRKEDVNHQLWRSFCKEDGFLLKALKSRAKVESIRRQHLCSTSLLKRESEDDMVADTKRECGICFYDLYLSSIACSCSPNRYACLRHAKQLCSCAWSKKCFYFRYGDEEMDSLVAALEGNLKAIHLWAKKKGKDGRP